jgi:hypothetical protein
MLHTTPNSPLQDVILALCFCHQKLMSRALKTCPIGHHYGNYQERSIHTRRQSITCNSVNNSGTSRRRITVCMKLDQNFEN